MNTFQICFVIASHFHIKLFLFQSLSAEISIIILALKNYLLSSKLIQKKKLLKVFYKVC